MNPDELRDIHPPVLLPEAADYTMLIGGLIALCVVLAVLFWFFRLRKKNDVLPPAHATALAALAEARSMMTTEQAIEYAATLSDILRGYIEKRFAIQTTRQTTKEFFASLSANPNRTARLLENHHDSLKTCLDQCDMAKFARCTPDTESMENMETAVENFIKATSETDEKGGQ